MKKLSIVSGLASLILFLVAFNVSALPIDIYGSIEIVGTPVLDNPDYTQATEFTSFSNNFVLTTSGAYSAIPITTGATFNKITFAPSPVVPITPLWSVTYSGVTYDFDATTMSVTQLSADSIKVEGLGTATITGATTDYNPTAGVWSVTSQTKNGVTFSFSSSTAVPEPVSALLVGFGLVALAVFRKKCQS